MMKILAMRQSTFIATYIHKDQVGFIQGRQGPDQIRRAIDIISNGMGGQQEGFLLSTDLQKAFDSIAWPYLFEILERWGFGPKFLGIIHSLYSIPSAQIRLMGHYSDTVNIQKGTRQGCPLSLLIFAIAIETLALTIRSHPETKGVFSGPQEHKCVLFTDDILLFITSPLISTPNVIQLLQDFGALQ